MIGSGANDYKKILDEVSGKCNECYKNKGKPEKKPVSESREQINYSINCIRSIKLWEGEFPVNDIEMAQKCRNGDCENARKDLNELKKYA